MSDSPTEARAFATREDHVGLITLNRPRRRNAVDRAMSHAVADCMAAFARDPKVRVVVVTGAGSAFCSGADLQELADGTPVESLGHPDFGFAGLVQHRIAKPVVAAVNGDALGGGTEIILACDLAVIDERARVGLPEVRHGLFAAAGGVLRLASQTSTKRAMQLALTGEPIDAATAVRWGLANVLAPAGAALDLAMALAARVAANSPRGVEASTQLIRTSLELAGNVDGAWAANDALAREVFTSPDARDGTRAFVEQRTPNWCEP